MDLHKQMITYIILFSSLLITPSISITETFKATSKTFGSPFNGSYYNIFEVLPTATISNGALQITPDSINGNFTLAHNSGRIFFNQSFTLWEDANDPRSGKGGTVASFNTSFLVNIYRVDNSSLAGEGFAFLIAPDLQMPLNSSGQYLGLTNATTDNDPSNQIVAVELDTFKQSFDPDDNHMGLDIFSVKSNKTVSLSQHGIQLAPVGSRNYMVWIHYDGVNRSIDVYMAEEGESKPNTPILTSDLDLRKLVNKKSYFGFAASTGDYVQLNCVLAWNLTVEQLNDDEGVGGGGSSNNRRVKILLSVMVPIVVLMLIGVGGLGYYIWRKKKVSESNLIAGALKSLPGMPREFAFRDLKKATNNFDEKHKLGQGGFGVVYKGVLPNENIAVAVKKFSRDNMKGQDDFLAELTIINRLRHKHLVRLHGWCHKNGVLLLVYEFMPNGSLDMHLFPESPEKPVLEWRIRYNIISGVASALHYLHYEYDQKVVHRDLKASNVMLDSNFNARLGDFGLARALENEKTSYAELEGVPGTVGYIAPECFHTGKATRESDVYGFGAVVLEVVCGQRPWTKNEGFNFLVDWVWSLHREGRILDAVDPRLTEYDSEEAKRLLLLGLACSHPIASERPKTQAIFQIISGSLPVPRVSPFKPPFVYSSTPEPDTSSSLNTDVTADTTPMSGWSPFAPDGFGISSDMSQLDSSSFRGATDSYIR